MVYKTDKNDNLKKIDEKPDLNFLINGFML